MLFNVKKTVVAATTSTLLATGAFAGSHALSGDLVIFSDMSNPAPRAVMEGMIDRFGACLLYTSPSPRDRTRSRMPSSA